jgi:sugar O-acyltransferase (sialic acid O-acetyltransferase NeuD family)
MSECQEVIIVGAGGVASEALWLCQRINQMPGAAGLRVLGFTDDNPERTGQKVEGLEILGTAAQIAKRYGGQGVRFHCAIGHNRARQRISALLEAAGLTPLSLIDPSAIIAPTATVGDGSFVGPLSIVAPHARVGRHVLINTQVSAGHHCEVGDFAQLCPGVRVSGHGRVGEGGFLGSNAVLNPGAQVGAWATLGAASFALTNIPASATAIGNPARVILR